MCTFCVKLRESSDYILRFGLFDISDSLNSIIGSFTQLIVDNPNRENIMITLASEEKEI